MNDKLFTPKMRKWLKKRGYNVSTIVEVIVARRRKLSDPYIYNEFWKWIQNNDKVYNAFTSFCKDCLIEKKKEESDGGGEIK